MPVQLKRAVPESRIFKLALLLWPPLTIRSLAAALEASSHRLFDARAGSSCATSERTSSAKRRLIGGVLSLRPGSSDSHSVEHLLASVRFDDSTTESSRKYFLLVQTITLAINLYPDCIPNISVAGAGEEASEYGATGHWRLRDGPYPPKAHLCPRLMEGADS